MAIGLILDDERYYRDITWVDLPNKWLSLEVRSPPYFIQHVLWFNIAWVSFDHDLAWNNSAGKDVTGYDCLKWLCRHLDRHPEKPIPQVFFHSKNPVGVDNMRSYWNNWLNNRQLEE